MEGTHQDRSVTAAFTAVHFLVDLACIFLLTAFLLRMVENRAVWMACVLVYNFCAFACQLPVGALGDRRGNPFSLAAVGCLLIAIAYGMTSFGTGFLPEKLLLRVWPLFICTAAGLGNSCFHVGGGIEVLRRSREAAALPGVFVATGAFGVWLGPVLARKELARNLGIFAGILIMASCAVLLMCLRRRASGDTLERKPEAGDILGAAALCLIVTVLIRSYAGTVMGYGWKAGMLSFLFTAGIVFGKMAGGFFGDRFGWMKTACVSLAGAALLFALAETSPVCGIAAVLLFNMTMPLTLSALALLYKDAVGLAFGMLTLALFLGTLPSMMSAAGWIPAGSFTLLPALSLLSAALMALGLSLFSRRRGDGA